MSNDEWADAVVELLFARNDEKGNLLLVMNQDDNGAVNLGGWWKEQVKAVLLQELAKIA